MLHLHLPLLAQLGYGFAYGKGGSFIGTSGFFLTNLPDDPQVRGTWGTIQSPRGAM